MDLVNQQLEKKNSRTSDASNSTGFVENLSQFPIVRKRRDAFRLMKIHEYNGHEFVAKFFSQFTFCSFCNEFLW